MRVYLIFLSVLFAGCIAHRQHNLEKMSDLPGFMSVTLDGKKVLIATTETTNDQWIRYNKSIGITALGSMVADENPYNSCLENMLSDSLILVRDTSWISEKGRKNRSQVRCGKLPVTGITYVQAIDYCKYLERLYANRFPAYRFRLPAPEEMTALLGKLITETEGSLEAKSSGQNPYRNGYIRMGCLVVNFRFQNLFDCNLEIKHALGYGVPFPVANFFPSDDGVYDLLGNVAEMTSVKGVAMGGSCKDDISACQPGVTNRYEVPAYWLGFRVLAELK